MIVRLALLYGAEYWPIKRSHIQRMSIAEMRMIRWIRGHARFDKIKNEVIRGEIGVVSMRETRLRWVGHIRRRNMDASVRRYEKIDHPDYRRSRGRSKKS